MCIWTYHRVLHNINTFDMRKLCFHLNIKLAQKNKKREGVAPFVIIYITHSCINYQNQYKCKMSCSQIHTDNVWHCGIHTIYILEIGVHHWIRRFYESTDSMLVVVICPISYWWQAMMSMLSQTTITICFGGSNYQPNQHHITGHQICVIIVRVNEPTINCILNTWISAKKEFSLHYFKWMMPAILQR